MSIGFSLVGDCHDTVGRKDRCVAGAIYNYTEQLTSGYKNSIFKGECKHINLLEFKL